MKRKLIALLIGLLALLGVAGVTLAQAEGDGSKETVEQGEDDDAQENESSEDEGEGEEESEGVEND